MITKEKKLNILRFIIQSNLVTKEIKERLEDEIACILRSEKVWSVS